MKLTIPRYIDRLIFEKLGGIYSPGEDVDINLYNNKIKTKKYLGTYFPRSFAESYHIFKFLLSKQKYKEILLSKYEIKILDIGAGTGGNLTGLLYAFLDNLPHTNNFKIITMDGNELSFKYQNVFINNVKNYYRKKIEFQSLHGSVDSKKGLKEAFSRAEKKFLTQDFDFIISSKFLSELYSQNPEGVNNHYFDLLNIAGKYLSESGIISLIDITSPDRNGSRGFMPYIINEEVSNYLRTSNDLAILAPRICKEYMPCKNPKECFRQRVMFVNHSKKSRDVSKHYYIVLGKSHLVANISDELKIIKEVSYKRQYNDEICNGICNEGEFKWI